MTNYVFIRSSAASIVPVFAVVFSMLSITLNTASAKSTWSNYGSVVKQPTRQAQYDRRYAQNPHVHYGHPAQDDDRYATSRWPRQDGVTVIYQQNVPVQQGYDSGNYDSGNYNYQRQVFINGQPLPELYRDSQYRINDWSRYQLDQPLYGRHWVRVNNSYLLIKDDNFIIEMVR